MYAMALSEFLFDQRYYKRGIQSLFIEILFEVFLWSALPWINVKMISKEKENWLDENRFDWRTLSVRKEVFMPEINRRRDLYYLGEISAEEAGLGGPISDEDWEESLASFEEWVEWSDSPVAVELRERTSKTKKVINEE